MISSLDNQKIKNSGISEATHFNTALCSQNSVNRIVNIPRLNDGIFLVGNSSSGVKLASLERKQNSEGNNTVYIKLEAFDSASPWYKLKSELKSALSLEKNDDPKIEEPLPQVFRNLPAEVEIVSARGIEVRFGHTPDNKIHVFQTNALDKKDPEFKTGKIIEVEPSIVGKEVDARHKSQQASSRA